MSLRPPSTTRTYTLFPYTTLFRSKAARLPSAADRDPVEDVEAGRPAHQEVDASPADVFDQEIAHVGTDPKCFHRGIEPHTKNQVGEVAKNDDALILAGAKIIGDSGGRTENRILDRFRSPHRLAIGGAQVLQRGPRARRHDRVLVHPLQNGIALQQPPQAIYDGLVVSKQADTRGGADSRGAVDALRLVALAAAGQPDPVDLLRQRPMHDRH